MSVLLVNPNGNAAATIAMADIAHDAAPTLDWVTFTNAGAPGVITDEDGLTAAGTRLKTHFADPCFLSAEAIVLAAFADPCLTALRARCHAPVTGIAEAGMAEAAAGGRRFAVVTTTPGLVDGITRLAERYGYKAQFAGVETTIGTPEVVMADPIRLAAALLTACQRAIAGLKAEAIVIGGGPLATAARAIAPHVPVPLIEPVPAAARLTMKRLGRA